MARFNIWIRGYVLGLLREPSQSRPHRPKNSRKRKVSTGDISSPIPLAPEKSPFPKTNPLPRSLSVQNFSAPNPSGHTRNLSAEVEVPRSVAIAVDNNASHVKPDSVLDSWETATLREDEDNLSPLSPSGNKRFTYGPLSPGAPPQPYDPLNGNVRLSMATDARRISHYGAVSRLEREKVPTDRMTKRMSKRMTWGLETYNTHSSVYAPL